jgi:hypothetical protein
MRTRHQLATGLVVALSGASLAAPALAASGQDLRSPDAIDAASGGVHSAPAIVPRQDLRSPDAVDAGLPRVAAPAGAPVVVSPRASQSSASSGFDWGSAAIGAAGTIGLLGVALGSGLVVHHRRRTPVAHPPIAH